MSMWQPAPEPKTELGRYRVLSENAGIRVSPFCLGAMSIGEAWKEVMGSMDKEQSFKLLDFFFESGGNFIDTANNYQGEESEKWLGEWMTERKNRDQIVLATKFTTDYRGHAIGAGNGPNYCGNHKKSLHLSVRDSLKKLQTDYIDLLYIHWWDHTTSVPELMDSLHILVQQSKVLYLGVSDTPAWIVAAANTYAIAHGKTPFSVYQGRWNIMQRDFEREIIPMARHFGMALCPWSVVGGGKIQSRKQMEERRKNNEKLRKMRGTGDQTEKEEKMSEALENVAKEHGVDNPATIAIAYVMAKAVNVFPLIGGRKIEHLQENIKALSIKLTDKQIEYLESINPFEIGFPNDFIAQDPHLTGKAPPLLAANAQFAFVRAPKPIGHE